MSSRPQGGIGKRQWSERVDEPLLDRAGDLDSTDLRSLDAVHLAAALELSSDVGVMFVYDTRLEEAAQAYGLDVDSPA